jgi:hypothetical protein
MQEQYTGENIAKCLSKYNKRSSVDIVERPNPRVSFHLQLERPAGPHRGFELVSS